MLDHITETSDFTLYKPSKAKLDEMGEDRDYHLMLSPQDQYAAPYEQLRYFLELAPKNRQSGIVSIRFMSCYEDKTYIRLSINTKHDDNKKLQNFFKNEHGFDNYYQHDSTQHLLSDECKPFKDIFEHIGLNKPENERLQTMILELESGRYFERMMNSKLNLLASLTMSLHDEELKNKLMETAPEELKKAMGALNLK